MLDSFAATMLSPTEVKVLFFRIFRFSLNRVPNVLSAQLMCSHAPFDSALRSALSVLSIARIFATAGHFKYRSPLSALHRSSSLTLLSALRRRAACAAVSTSSACESPRK